MSFKPQDAVILIPCLEPDDRLTAYSDALLAKGFEHIIIVDDGSSQANQHVFDELSAKPGVTVLHHEVNRGKGVALKTGYAWIEKNLPDCSGVITADADGQHTVADCWKLAEALLQGENALYLGSRDFNLPNVPPKSRSGNKITSVVFKLFYGQYLPDTQTGLRAFRREELGFMQQVNGERYEYEMEVLIACARRKLPMIPITIETVYENNNEGTHFHPIRDSYRIYKVILGNFVKFAGVSILSWVLDNALANLLYHVLLSGLGVGLRENVSGYAARLISSVFNYLMNRRLVFESKESVTRSSLKYAVLALGIITISNGFVSVLDSLGLPYAVSKIVVDLLLYFLSYRVQRAWVFAPKKGAKA